VLAELLRHSPGTAQAARGLLKNKTAGQQKSSAARNPLKQGMVGMTPHPLPRSNCSASAEEIAEAETDAAIAEHEAWKAAGGPGGTIPHEVATTELLGGQ